MLALVAMRFLVPACRALIVSLPGDHARAVPVKATRQQRASAHRHQPGRRSRAPRPPAALRRFLMPEREPSSIRYEPRRGRA